MKKRIQSGARFAAVAAWTRVVADPIAAVRCWRAAQEDERRGYVFAAALEWRKAAALLAFVPAAAEHCWQQWERIMQLARQFANPIGAADEINFCAIAPQTSSATVTRTLCILPAA